MTASTERSFVSVDEASNAFKSAYASVQPGQPRFMAPYDLAEKRITQASLEILTSGTLVNPAENRMSEGKLLGIERTISERTSSIVGYGKAIMEAEGWFSALRQAYVDQLGMVEFLADRLVGERVRGFLLDCL